MLEQEHKISAVEGNSFSGKTSLVTELQSGYGFSVVQEPSYYVDSFPAFPPDTYGDAKKAIDLFASVEIQRSACVIKLAKQERQVIMDRSLWTYPAFQYVVMTRMPNIPNSYLYSLDVLQRHIEQGDIIAPRAIVSLVPKNREVFESRVTNRGRVDIDFLNDWGTTVLMDKWFRILINCIYSRGNGLTLFTENNIKEIASETNRFLQETNYFIDAILAFDQLRVKK